MKKLSRVSFRIFAIAMACGTVLFLMSAQNFQEWTVPAKFKTMKNPSGTSKEHVSSGKDLYAKHCKSCHGVTGLGDGPKAATLDVSSGDFTSAKFQGQTDGDIFYKITEGKGKMPAYKKTLANDADRWDIVSYIRTFKK